MGFSHEKDGAFATEVLHLWHREPARDWASSNLRLVNGRLANQTTQATQGLREHAAAYDAAVAQPAI